MNPDQNHSLLEPFGIKINEKTGGYLPTDISQNTFEISELGFYKMSTPNERPILVVNASMFLKTLARTEESLKIKLFS